MDKVNSMERVVQREAAKLISCVLHSETVEQELLRALYEQRQITRVNWIKCRGYASLFEVKTETGELPKPHFARMIEVTVPAAEADELFDFIYEKAGIGEPGAGVVFMTPLLGASSFSLPEDMLLEE